MADGDTAEVELEEIRYGNRVFSGSSAPALHEHPINKDLIAHFKSKGDSVSWGIAESIEKYEEDRKKKVSWGTDIASLYDQETECELAREVGDLTIEDPTDQLQRLRDVHDVKACLNLPELIAKVQMAAVEAASANAGREGVAHWRAHNKSSTWLRQS